MYIKYREYDYIKIVVVNAVCMAVQETLVYKFAHSRNRPVLCPSASFVLNSSASCMRLKQRVDKELANIRNKFSASAGLSSYNRKK